MSGTVGAASPPRTTGCESERPGWGGGLMEQSPLRKSAELPQHAALMSQGREGLVLLLHLSPA